MPTAIHALPPPLPMPLPMPSATQRPDIGLAPGTEIMTLTGIHPVETLRSGDRIITRAGACPLKALNCITPDRYRLEFREPQVVYLENGQIYSDTSQPFTT